MSVVHSSLLLISVLFWAIVTFMVLTLIFHFLSKITSGKISCWMSKISCLMFSGFGNIVKIAGTAILVIIFMFIGIGIVNLVQYLVHQI